MTVKLKFTQQEHDGTRRICCEIKSFEFMCTLLRPREQLCACRKAESNATLTVVEDGEQFKQLIEDPRHAYEFYAVHQDALS
jgi:hypothetical protein